MDDRIRQVRLQQLLLTAYCYQKQGNQKAAEFFWSRYFQNIPFAEDDTRRIAAYEYNGR